MGIIVQQERSDEIACPVEARQVRYIKLGRAGKWEAECDERGILRFGFGSATDKRFPLCQQGKWDELHESFRAEGKDEATATRFTNETRQFFEDDGSILWITFIGERFNWGFLEPGSAERHQDGNGVFRRIRGGWKDSDIYGGRLGKDNLAGTLTKLAAFRGTSCNVDVQDYVLRRINGHTVPEVERAINALAEMTEATLGMIRLLGPMDFEILVDLVFSSSGWRRQGVVGKTQKTLDLDLLLPSTGERAFVQVKSRTTSAVLKEYIDRIDSRDAYDRMFFVYHTGEASTDDPRVVVIGPEKLAEMAIEAGLTGWLIRKVS